jgi:hypothetical protein
MESVFGETPNTAGEDARAPQRTHGSEEMVPLGSNPQSAIRNPQSPDALAATGFMNLT